MVKLDLLSGKMAAGAYVNEAREWAHALTRAESRFPGDYGQAMSRVASKIKIPRSVLWNLRYRIPKSISVEHYATLGAAYDDRQRSLYKQERAEVSPKTPLGRLLVRAADYLAGEESLDQ
jgi:hypothetical protein